MHYIKFAIMLLVIILAKSSFITYAQEGTAVTTQSEVILYGDDRPARKPPGLRAKLYDDYNEVMNLLSLDPPEQEKALIILNDRDFEDKRRINAFEKAVFYNLIASIYQSQEKYDEALSYYKMVLDLEPLAIRDNIDIPYDLLDGANFLMGQLYFIKGEYQKSHLYLNNWLVQQETPTARNLIFIANAYYYAAIDEEIEKIQADNFIRTSISLINRAIKINESAAKEDWFVFLRTLHSNLNEDQIVFDITETLLTRWPKKQYWVELSGLYALEAGKDELSESEIDELGKLQLVALETAHRQGMLTTGRELETISQLFLYHEIPYKSSKTLEKALREGISQPTYKNFDLLSIAYLQGKDMEKAINPLSKAAKLSDDGELFMRLANVYLQLDKYQEAASSIDAGIEKGGIDRPDLARFLQGQAYMALENFEQARAAFRLAAKDERTSKNATTWLNYIDREEQRIKDIREYLN
mgnify:CR=1 FL=1|tara:strand:- start:2299 stop:3708 length:1410 start_codon:yes stop_codon:yes gene_type:complete